MMEEEGKHSGVVVHIIIIKKKLKENSARLTILVFLGWTLPVPH